MKTESEHHLAIVNHRFETMMTSLFEANELMGRETPGLITYEDSEQGYARRELLIVEKQAIENRQRAEMTQQAYVDAVRNDFHKQLLGRLETEIRLPGAIFSDWLGLSNSVPELLDLLSVKACTIPRIEPLVARIPWMYPELLKIVNAPQHRRKDSRGKVIIVETLRAALSFINIENLQLIIPTLVFRRCIPQITDPYPEIKQHIWHYALSVALTNRYLAPFYKIRANDAYVLGLLQALGRNAVTRIYFKLFERLQREALEKAQANKKRDLHDALTQITPSNNFLSALWNDYADIVTAEILQYMKFKRLGVSAAMQSIASATVAKDALPLAQLTERSRWYAKYRMLKASKLLDNSDANCLIRATALDKPKVLALNRIDLRHLPLNFSSSLDELE
ncbi:HDOD domain-containing protein [Alteromonas flava]|uniref:HDOD domain-containing protein n=1 Tax=Alteromonas flava TaxID=2048003 RepID=UPI000C290BE6|nr:HDOD domain-containing protein [Alteromonas flava]